MNINKTQLLALGIPEATFAALPQATQTALLEGLKAQETHRASIERESQIKVFRDGGPGVLITEIVKSSTGRTKCEFTVVTNTGIKGCQHRGRMAQSLTGNLYVPGAAPRWLNITGSLLAKAIRHAMDNWKGEPELFITHSQIMATPVVDEDALGVEANPGLAVNQENADKLNTLLGAAAAADVHADADTELEEVTPVEVVAPQQPVAAPVAVAAPARKRSRAAAPSAE